MKLSVFALLFSLVAPSAFAADFRVALVLDKGGKDDRSFNAAAYKGAMKAKEDLKVFVKYVEATDDNAFDSLLRAFARKKFDLVLAVGITQADALKKVAARFPETHFAIVDAEVKLPNVRSLLFEEHQASFLVGAAAAMASKTGKIGFIGGMDIPLIRRFELGYESGARMINPKAKLVSNFIGITGEAWNNPAKAKELAMSQYSSGVDVIFSPAGASNTGVFDAAEETGKLVIGVDSNQNWMKPGHVLTSMLKRVDVAVYNVISEASEGKFQAGTKRYGLDSQGVDYSVDQYNEKLLPESYRKRLEDLKAAIISGKLKVPDYYEKR